MVGPAYAVSSARSPTSRSRTKSQISPYRHVISVGTPPISGSGNREADRVETGNWDWEMV